MSSSGATIQHVKTSEVFPDCAWALAQRGPIEKEAEQILLLPRLIEMFKRFGVKVEEV